MNKLFSKKTKYDYIEMCCYLLLLAATFLFLYKMMSKIIYGLSDHTAHIDAVKLLFAKDKGDFMYMHIFTYPLYHFVVKIMAHFVVRDYFKAGIVVLCGFSVLSAVLYRQLVLCMLFGYKGSRAGVSYKSEKNYIKLAMVDIISVCLVFFGTIPCFLDGGRYFNLQGGANPWHNPTVIALRPFAIISVILIIRLIDTLSEDNEFLIENYIVLAVTMFLSVLAKPSWGLVFIPVLGLYILVYALKDFKGNIKSAVMLGTTVVPSGIMMIIQMFGNKDMVSETFRFQIGGSSGLSIGNILLSTIPTIPVCILAVIFMFDEIKQLKGLFFLFMLLLMSWFEMFFMTNGPTGDFGWGYVVAIGITTAVSLALIIKKYYLKPQMWISLVIFLTQVFFGVQYLLLYFRTDEYSI